MSVTLSDDPALAFTLDEAGHLDLATEPLSPSGLVITATGELDIATVPQLRTAFADAFAAGVTRLVVDLRPLAFLDSVAVAALLHARREVGDAGRLAVVVAPDSYAHLIFEVAGLSHCLDVFPTRDEAIAHVER